MCDGGIGLLADAIEGLVMNILVGFHDFEESVVVATELAPLVSLLVTEQIMSGKNVESGNGAEDALLQAATVFVMKLNQVIQMLANLTGVIVIKVIQIIDGVVVLDAKLSALFIMIWTLFLVARKALGKVKKIIQALLGGLDRTHIGERS